MLTFDETKRQENIAKHGLDFLGCDAVFDHPVVTAEDDREAYSAYMSSPYGRPLLMKRVRTSSSFPTSPAAVRAAIARAPKRVRDADVPYDPNDKASVEAFWSGATVRRPGERGPGKKPAKLLLSLRVDRAVVERWKATGPGWQTRMAEALAKAV